MKHLSFKSRNNSNGLEQTMPNDVTRYVSVSTLLCFSIGMLVSKIIAFYVAA